MRAWLVVLVLLAGCASAPAGLPRAGAVSEGDRADPASVLRRLGAADSLTLEGARALFGGADVERREGAGAILTYRTANCAVTLVFAADGAGALRLGAMEARARDQRAAPPPLEQCVNEAMARRATS